MLQFNVDRFAVMIELGAKVHNLSMRELSELTGIGESTLYQLKKGEYAPTMVQFTRVCDAFEIDPASFFKNTKGK